VVEALIERTVQRLGDDSETAYLFANCFPNTLDTTVDFTDGERPDTFVITGDIAAMWLRDSSAQVWPYIPLAPSDPKLARLIAGVINRQTDCILIDPYANAFFKDTVTVMQERSSETEMRPGVFERKWELDSLCYAIRLAHGYWKTTGDTAPFDEAWQDAMGLVVRTFEEQQRRNGQGPYRFARTTARTHDTMPGMGAGRPMKACGLIVSGFRPSDDACDLPFLVPSNLFAVRSLYQLAEMAEAIRTLPEFALRCRHLASEISKALETVALGPGPHGFTGGPAWCYECDGFGNRMFMDDANVPSLLSLPYLGCCSDDAPAYLATRAWVLSDHNPYFFRGREAEGVSSPHKGREMVWPMSIIMRGLTTRDPAERARCIKTLTRTHAGTGFMHESFDANNSRNYSRPWFAWANTLFGELVLKDCGLANTADL
jgi:meiotically up-regulated gene 157 (Mug157) protein